MNKSIDWMAQGFTATMISDLNGVGTSETLKELKAEVVRVYPAMAAVLSTAEESMKLIENDKKRIHAFLKFSVELDNMMATTAVM